MGQQGCPIQPGLGLGLQPLTQVQEMAPATTEFASQLGRRHPLGETAENQDDLRWPPLGALEDGPGPGVEDSAAPATAIIEDGLTERAMRVESFGGVTARAAQPGRMIEIEQELIACVFIHKILDWEIHRLASWETGCPVS